MFVNLAYFLPAPALHLRAGQVNAHTAVFPAVSQCSSRLSGHTTGGSRWRTGWWEGLSTRDAQNDSPWSGRPSMSCGWLYWWRTWWARCSLPLYLRTSWTCRVVESSELRTSHCSVWCSRLSCELKSLERRIVASDRWKLVLLSKTSRTTDHLTTHNGQVNGTEGFSYQTLFG